MVIFFMANCNPQNLSAYEIQNVIWDEQKNE
jgi:hypothetical protein